MRALDLREGKEFIEGIVGIEVNDDKLSFDSMRVGGEGSGVVGGGPDLDVDTEDLTDELEDLTDMTLDGEGEIGESAGCSGGVSCDCGGVCSVD
jgi:hypothetical protein